MDFVNFGGMDFRTGGVWIWEVHGSGFWKVCLGFRRHVDFVHFGVCGFDVRGGMCTSEGVWSLGGVCGLWHVDLGGGVALEVYVGVWTLGGVCVDIGRCTGWQVEGCSCG